MFGKIETLKHQDVAEQQFWNKIVTLNKIIEQTDPVMLESNRTQPNSYYTGPQNQN
jgi:hypothetical protein